jgi:hypothetical protein
VIWISEREHKMNIETDNASDRQKSRQRYISIHKY